MKRTTFRVISTPAAAVEALIEKAAAEIEAGAPFKKIADSKEAAIAFIRESPLDVFFVESLQQVVFESPLFLKARRSAMRAARRDFFGATRLEEVENGADGRGEERLVAWWECTAGAIARMDQP